jgi:hypothetical protein
VSVEGLAAQLKITVRWEIHPADWPASPLAHSLSCDAPSTLVKHSLAPTSVPHLSHNVATVRASTSEPSINGSTPSGDLQHSDFLPLHSQHELPHKQEYDSHKQCTCTVTFHAEYSGPLFNCMWLEPHHILCKESPMSSHHSPQRFDGATLSIQQRSNRSSQQLHMKH